MKQKFVEINFREDTLGVLRQANRIINLYEAQGYQLTLRQLYYQFVARDLIPNTERSYKKLGNIISDGRLAGLIDWNAIEDRTRNLRKLSHWDDPAEIIQSAYMSFALDKWDRQPNRVEVWVEKEALAGVVQRVCERHDVPFFSCRGYVSQSEMYVAASRLARYMDMSQDVTIIHLGDHDPSGIDMTRDIRDRLDLFLEGMGAEVNRIALNFDQINEYNPPPNPAKQTDSRFQGYSDQFGDESWELDALEPAVLDELIEHHILMLRDDDLWDEAEQEEAHHKELLQKASTKWPAVAGFLSNGNGKHK